MRLGGSVMNPYNSPEEWLAQVKELGYSAVIFPVNSDASHETRKTYADCARANDLLIGEVGIWKNLFSPDKAEAEAAFAWSVEQLALADEVGANCCVNISVIVNQMFILIILMQICQIRHLNFLEQ